MAKALHGELAVYIKNRTHTLRPSLGALYEIEQRAKMTIPEIITLLGEERAPAPLIRLVLSQGCQAAHNTLPALSPRALLSLSSAALAFLVQGLGFLMQPEEPAEAPEATLEFESISRAELPPSEPPAPDKPPLSFEPLKFDELYKTARMLLGIGESEFWQMTMPGLSLLSEACARTCGLDNVYIGPPASSNELQWMMEQFPDEEVVIRAGIEPATT